MFDNPDPTGLPSQRLISESPRLTVEYRQHGSHIVSVFDGETVILATGQDMLDLMSEARGKILVIHRHQISPAFFQLKTGVAGEILQKISNYRLRLGIIGDFSQVASPSLRDFIYESNKNRQVMFVGNLDEYLASLQ